jgi:predicted ABC-type transport system involved in lysophospholipase L1 biosynthesis ATPase subunit
MAGLIEPSGGQVLIEGTDLTRLPADERARRRGRSIGVVLQRDNLHPLLDLAANVQLPLRLAGVGARAASARADALLDQIGLLDRRHHYPSDVSGGEAQRAAVAAALAPHPAVLLADEPTGELDEPTARSVLDLLGKARDMGAAVLTVTHNPAVADRAERTLMMLDGIVAYA